MLPAKINKIKELARLLRYFILVSTSEAGSGHPSSCLSAADLMATLFFGGFFRYDLDNPQNVNNDRIIFSKGHSAPLLYSLYAAAGKLTESELKTLRKFSSSLEGHPMRTFKYSEAATGSLGQGLSVGAGMALGAKYLDKLPSKTYVLLGDGEMAEGSVWEAIQLAAFYKLDNLIGILDVNRLGQRGETMYGHNLKAYQKRISSFGWEVILTDGHNLKEIDSAFKKALKVKGKPVMIAAKTVKGKGVSFIEDRENWHGKAVPKDQLTEALKDIGSVDAEMRGRIAMPKNQNDNPPNKLPGSYTGQAMPTGRQAKLKTTEYLKPTATRKAYGNALVRIFPKFPNIVALDGEVSNSTYAETFKKTYPKNFFEMYIAEQNMVGTALGLSLRGKIPFVSTFGAFFTRAFDQIRMARYSEANIKFVGSHAGVSIGQDGPSQMGLEDIALFRAIPDSIVLYPSDAISAERLVEEAANHDGIVYIRTTRNDTPILYKPEETFPIGKSKVLKESVHDVVTIAGAGITVHEALSAWEELKKEGISARVIDLYSIKPIDEAILKKAASETKAIIVAEDHYPEGGIGEAVVSALAGLGIAAPVFSLAVRKIPKSGKSSELLDYEEISSNAIIKKTKQLI